MILLGLSCRVCFWLTSRLGVRIEEQNLITTRIGWICRVTVQDRIGTCIKLAVATSMAIVLLTSMPNNMKFHRDANLELPFRVVVN